MIDNDDFWATMANEPEKKDAGKCSVSEDFKAIPNKTQLLAVVEKAKLDENDYTDGEFVKLQWSVLSPPEYKNRKVFQNIKINDAKKAKKAREMLLTIDFNAGGKLKGLGHKPESHELAHALVNGQMLITMGLFVAQEDDGTDKEINYVMAVEAKGSKPAAEKVAPNPDGTTGVQPDDIDW